MASLALQHYLLIVESVLSWVPSLCLITVLITYGPFPSKYKHNSRAEVKFYEAYNCAPGSCWNKLCMLNVCHSQVIFKTLLVICLALRPFPISVALLWTLSSSLMAFLPHGTPNCTQCLRWGHTSAWGGGDKGLSEQVYMDNCCPSLSISHFGRLTPCNLEAPLLWHYAQTGSHSLGTRFTWQQQEMWAMQASGQSKVPLGTCSTSTASYKC